MIEFTIVLPLVLLLMLGVTELGRAIVRYNTLTKALRDGARYASAFALNGTTGRVQIEQELETKVRNFVVYGNTAGTGSPVLQGLSIEQITVTESGLTDVRVDGSYPYVPLFGPALPSFGLGSSTTVAFTMQASVTMRGL